MKRTSGGFPPGVKRWARAKELPSTSETPPDTTSDNPSPSEA
ncbi:hypothetical protein [Streptomyces sp. PTY087I2]|nr:hypothetical protein [Streptomyces sp. PTY087I2]